MIDNLNKPDIIWNIPGKIFVRENVISSDLCKQIISEGQNNVIKGINKYPNRFGISFHSCLLPLDHQIHTELRDTWKDIINFLKFDIDFVEPYELKRYTEKDYFGKHIDNYYSLSIDIDRKITMSLQLSDSNDYSGGEFVIAGQSYKLEKGSVIAFPSFFSHEVKPIDSGIRWSLVNWAWGPYWR